MGKMNSLHEATKYVEALAESMRIIEAGQDPLAEDEVFLEQTDRLRALVLMSLTGIRFSSKKSDEALDD